MKTISLDIYTPNRRVFQDQVSSMVLPGSIGQFGVLAEHAPMVAGLSPGLIKIQKDHAEIKFRCGAGFAEVMPDRVTVLVDSAEGNAPAPDGAAAHSS